MDYHALAVELTKPAYDGLSNDAAAAALSAPTATRSGPRVMSAVELIPLVSGPAFRAVFAHPTFLDFKRAVNAGDRQAVCEWAVAYYLAGMLGEAERDAVIGYATGEVPHPATPAELSGCGQTVVSEHDVAHARGL